MRVVRLCAMGHLSQHLQGCACFCFKLVPVSECTKIARFSAVAAAILTAPLRNRTTFKALSCAFWLAIKHR